ncbi:J domain-containing protein [Marinicrinis lubricantis]|uniref:DnaJ domain-containing protein n=1 Tax=Marinicrinis lubricantis TaxID=2086470 RepID=A0ABW1IP80_9BACL
MKTYYDILGVARNASADDIKKAYRKLAKKHHPDANQGNPESSRIFQEMVTAYQTLSDGSARQRYDAELDGRSEQAGEARKQQPRTQSSAGLDMANVAQSFERFFGFDPKTGERKKNSREQAGGQPLHANAWFESYFGVRKK